MTSKSSQINSWHLSNYSDEMSKNDIINPFIQHHVKWGFSRFRSERWKAEIRMTWTETGICKKGANKGLKVDQSFVKHSLYPPMLLTKSKKVNSKQQEDTSIIFKHRHKRSHFNVSNFPNRWKIPKFKPGWVSTVIVPPLDAWIGEVLPTGESHH